LIAQSSKEYYSFFDFAKDIENRLIEFLNSHPEYA